MSDRWVKRWARVVPQEIREPFLSDLIEERERRRDRGDPRWRIELASARELLVGAAQHLRVLGRGGVMPQPATVRVAYFVGWPAWQVATPVLFLGCVLRVPVLTWAGAALLGLTLAAAVVPFVAGRPPLGPRVVRWLFGLTLGIVFWALLAGLFGIVAAPASVVVALVRGDPVLPLLGRALHVAVAVTGLFGAAASDGLHRASERDAVARQA